MLAMTMPVLAQDIRSNQVPSIVLNSFKKEFPQASGVDWEMKNGIYEVEFEIKRLDHHLWLDAQGELVKHEQEIKARDLPAKIRQKIRSSYKGYRITEADQLTLPDRTLYKLELKTLTKEMNLVVDGEGQVIQGFIW